MTLFEAQTGGAFDRLNWQHSREFDQNFSKKSNAPQGGGMGGFGIDRYIIVESVLLTRMKSEVFFYFVYKLVEKQYKKLPSRV